jgi:hypothetical protein
MKHRAIIFLALLFLASCGIEKRHYRPGFYIPQHSFAEKQEPQECETVSDTLTEREIPGAVASAGEQEAAFKEADTNKVLHPPLRCMKTPEIKPYRMASQILPELRQSQQKIIKAKKGSYIETEDILLIIGLALILAGLTAIIIASTALKANPAMYNIAIGVGAVLILLGYIVAAIGYPEILLEVLVDIIFGLLGG